MRSIFLYGDVSDNFPSLSEPFIRASGGRKARIALMMLPNSYNYEARYREPWLKTGVYEVRPIYPSPRLTLSTEQLRTIKESTGIFMSGGNISLYQRIYGTRAVSLIINNLYRSGIPYGGVSAGAMMACDLCTTAGSKIVTKNNEYLLMAKPCLTVDEKVKSKPVLRKGLGLLGNCVVQPHFSEWGLFPKLFTAMMLAHSHFAIGIDEGICVEIENETHVTVRGLGRAYILARKSETPTLQVRAYGPNSNFVIRNS